MKITFIAEIGINHNGNLDLARQMIDISKEAGADIVKFQKRDIETVYNKEILDAPRNSPWGTTTREQKYGLEFERKEYDVIDSYCKKKGIEWFASAWDLKSLEFLKKYNSRYNKIASAMIVDKKFLKTVALEKKHTFISTGMCELSDIDEAVKIFSENECPFEVMHCVSAYPFDESKTSANLNLINIYKERYNCNVGYSGHEKGGLAISLAASGMGISSIERHITIDRSSYGSDQPASIEPAGLRQLIISIRKIENAFNNNKKTMLEEEKLIAKKLRAHLDYEQK
jgi:N-acetylneuraminate synthase